MKELSLVEMEQMSKSGQQFAVPADSSGRMASGRDANPMTGAGIASTADRAPLGFWVLGAALRALWLKV